MKKILLLFLLLAACRCSYTQPAHLSVDNLSTDSGLPSNVVNDIIQDNQGYMWFATYRGVVRYDGYTMHTYNLRPAENSGYNEDVSRLFKDNQGNIWASQWRDGIFRYDRSTDRFIHYVHDEHDKKSLPYNNVVFLFKGQRNDVWIMTRAEKFSIAALSISRFDEAKGKFTNYGPGEKGRYHLDHVGLIAADSSGNLWMTGKGRYQFDEKQQTFVKTASFPFWISGSDKTFGDKNIIWMTSDAGLVKFNIKKNSYLLLKHDVNDSSSLQNDTLNHFFQDKLHRPWLVTNAGFSLLNPATNKFTNFPFDKNIPKGFYWGVPDISGNFWFWIKDILAYFNTQTGRYNIYPLNNDVPQSLRQYVRAAFVDDNNSLWIANILGVSRINNVRSAFTSYPVNSLSFTGSIQTFLEAGKNTVYLGTDRLYAYNLENHSIKRIKYSDDSLENARGFIMSLLKNADGTIVVGSTELVIFNPKSGATRAYNYNSKPVYCSSVIPDGENGYWVGSQVFGLLYFDRKAGKFTGFGYNQSGVAKPDKCKLDDKEASIVYKDKSGTLWVGTYEGGLNRFNANDSSFTSFFYRYPEMTVIDDIHEDNRRQFWIATDFSGLFLLDRKTGKIIRHFTQKDGLLSNGIDRIIEDKNGRIWLTNTLGLVSIDTKTFALKRYTHDNALPTSNINWIPYKMSDGTELFSTLNGFFRFRFDDLKPDPDPPVVHIELVLHSNPTSASPQSDTVRALVQKQVELPYSQNRVTFTFVALHYSFPLANRYSYKLINFDKNWVSSQSQRSVIYNNLSPGTYTFQVKAANGNGVWNNKGDTFTLIIDAPWWLRWWAWLLWIVLFVSAIYGFVAYRSRKLIQDKRVLEHKVHIRTEEVMQQKEEIESQRDNLKKAFGDLKATQTQLIQSEKMASLGELTAGIAHEIQNPLNFVNNFSEVSKELLGELKEELDKGDIEEAKLISGDVIQNLEKINHHGKRADAIVKGMLEHSRVSSGKKEPTDINALADEYLRLSCHGLRAKDKNFNAEMVTNFDVNLPKISVIPQDIGRVFLNLFNNAFYAVNQKAKTAGAEYKPEVSVTTSHENGKVIIVVKDNGVGIPDAIKEKIMQPFFTTKPTGEGTGLGLSLTYDMVVKGHGGSIAIESQEFEYSEIIVTLPLI